MTAEKSASRRSQTAATGMSFDALAPIYTALESVVFGNALQRARVALLNELTAPKHALVVGEGAGRFLEQFVRRFPTCAVDCIDASAAMLRVARERLAPADRERVRFMQLALPATELPQASYDCIVTNFFLDCFDAHTLPLVVAAIADTTSNDAVWLVTEFAIPRASVRRQAARVLIAAMYLFFRLTTGISGRRLVDYRAILRQNGFACAFSSASAGGLLASELWRRESGASLL